MQAAAEAAVEARQNKVLENQELVSEMKEESKKLEEQRELELKEVEVRKKEQRAKVIEERQGVKVALEIVKDSKKHRAEKITAEKARMARKIAEGKVAEQARKEDLIRQLRALEKSRPRTTREFDPTEVVDNGLLNQMSLVEVKQTLEMLKERRSTEEGRTTMLIG